MQITKATDFNVIECYVEPVRRKLVACSLLTFGFRQFKTATIIKRIDEIDDFFKANDENYVLKYFPSIFSDVLFESLIDSIRISICFENYFKAKLLLNGFLIHKINKDESKKIFDKQKISPIEVSEVVAKPVPSALPQLKKCLQQNTLNYSTILGSSSYRKYLNVADGLIEFLEIINRKRNNLHLHTNELTTLSRKIVSDYKLLCSIVDIDIAILQNTLLSEIDPQSKMMLPMKTSC